MVLGLYLMFIFIVLMLYGETYNDVKFILFAKHGTVEAHCVNNLERIFIHFYNIIMLAIKNYCVPK